jgi:hypothetical protein
MRRRRVKCAFTPGAARSAGPTPASTPPPSVAPPPRRSRRQGTPPPVPPPRRRGPPWSGWCRSPTRCINQQTATARSALVLPLRAVSMFAASAVSRFSPASAGRVTGGCVVGLPDFTDSAQSAVSISKLTLHSRGRRHRRFFALHDDGTVSVMPFRVVVLPIAAHVVRPPGCLHEQVSLALRFGHRLEALGEGVELRV